MTATPAMPDLTAVIKWLENGCDPREAVKELKHYQSKLQALATLQAQPAEVSDAEILVVAEFVWLIGPRSRVGESHDAAVRFARAILALRPQSYPLPDDLYDSKDWRQGNYASRVEWLHTMYEHAKHERDEYTAQLEALRSQSVPMTDEPVHRLPMTDEQAKQLLKQSDLLDMFLHIGWYSAPRKGFDQHALSLIRAIEAHHGITAPAGGEQPAAHQATKEQAK